MHDHEYIKWKKVVQLRELGAFISKLHAYYSFYDPENLSKSRKWKKKNIFIPRKFFIWLTENELSEENAKIED